MMIDERNRQNLPNRNRSYEAKNFARMQPSRAVTQPGGYPYKTSSIVFFGSGPVAAASLAGLIDSFNLEAVVTKTVPLHHKEKAPVEELARARGMPVYFANTRGELDALLNKEQFKSKLGLIVDYGVIVSQKAIDYFELGIINSHFSLLPRWRGADPITFAILAGDKETGVSLMQIVPALDEGKLLSQDSLPIGPKMTTPELTEQLVGLSNQMLKRDIPAYFEGKLPLYDQPNSPATYSRKLTKADGTVDWTKSAAVIEREIRAYIEWPKSRTTLAGKDIILTQAHVAGYDIHGTDIQEGYAFPTSDGLLGVACGEGVLVIDRLKPAGKNEMTSEAFIAGHHQFFEKEV